MSKFKKPFKRFCNRCEKKFQPSTKATRICEKCIKKGMKDRLKRNKIKREMKNKEKN